MLISTTSRVGTFHVWGNILHGQDAPQRKPYDSPGEGMVRISEEWKAGRRQILSQMKAAIPAMDSTVMKRLEREACRF